MANGQKLKMCQSGLKEMELKSLKNQLYPSFVFICVQVYLFSLSEIMV